ncbi:MAG: phosphotransferase [Gracilibacteraceae bacterium]|jgi:Ser/Thr protein kinase RdoA (MazF antagonist)|nr:phosphotransferase [Gracilibacteraceae bacterium]
MLSRSKEFFDEMATDALGLFGIAGTHRAELLQLSENLTYLISRRGGESDYVMRICRPGYHTAEELESELVWLGEIAENTSLITAQPFRGLDGRHIQRVAVAGESYSLTLFEFLPGAPPGNSDVRTTEREFEMLGAVTAQMHRQSRARDKSIPLPRFTWDFDTIIGRHPIWGGWQAAEGMSDDDFRLLTLAAAIIRGKLEDYGKSPYRFGLIHADLRLANLLVEGEKIKVIDFDDCGYSWYMYDQASAVSFIEHLPERPRYVAAWERGYRSELPLLPEDAAMSDTFIMMRRLQLLAWLTSHSESTPARALSVGYLAGTVELARNYTASVRRVFGVRPVA